MRFTTGELSFNATVSESSTETSPRTGAQVRTLTIQFRAAKQDMHAQALEAALLRRTGGVFSLDESGDRDAEWRIVDSGCTYIGSPPWGMNHHTWNLQQVERVVCSRLVVGSIELTPYDYAEQVLAEGVLAIAARCTVSDETLRMLRDLSEVVDVVRVGITDKPRRMRLDDYVWGVGAHGQGVVIRLEDDREPRVTLAGSDVPRDRQMLRALLDPERRHSARRVPDLDAWPL